MTDATDGRSGSFLPVLLAALVLCAGDVAACPVCDGGTGEAVRAGIMDANLGWNLLATLLPFSVVLGVVAAIHFSPPGRKRPAGRKDGGRHGH